ncbi:MAG: hypothetical protein NPIRA05_00570 [Nitrospirales bacterium]|nr:MAG: hypothetical protein NPIRA05_00570 [Nitrospirales bacterium]
MREQLPAIHSDFFSKFPDCLNLEHRVNPVALSEKQRTQASFGYEWTKFAQYSVDNFSLFIQPLEQGFLENKFGLDVGCGAGRHVRQATALGAEIVGFDLSHAIDIARSANDNNPRAHFVQGDVFNLPFRQGMFDFIYSLGVLHHLPNPEQGFQHLVPHLKQEASIFIWTYQRTKRKELLELVRPITTRLPLEGIKALSWLATVVDYGLFVNCYRLFQRYERIAALVPSRIKEYASYDFLSSYTDWFDRLSAPLSNFYNEEEIHAWFRRAGLSNITTSLVEDSWVWGKGSRG